MKQLDNFIKDWKINPMRVMGYKSKLDHTNIDIVKSIQVCMSDDWKKIIITFPHKTEINFTREDGVEVCEVEQKTCLIPFRDTFTREQKIELNRGLLALNIMGQ